MAGVTEEHDLYGLPLERFVSTRTELAKALRRDGQRERAGEVSSLRKPSVAAWAVNQLVRTQGREVTALFQAGDALGDAQSQLLAGRGDGYTLREAVALERDTVSQLVEQARGLLSSGGHELSQITLDRVSETLNAAALDDDARALVRDGCLVRELRHVGLGQGDATSRPASPPPPSPSPDAGRRAETKRTERERAETKRIERERAERLKLARKAQADARRAAERAERELHTAQARRDKAAESLQAADDALAAAREHAERATLERDRAHRELDQL